MKLWCCVTGVSRKWLEVALPHGLKGRVAAQDASNEAWDEAHVSGSMVTLILGTRANLTCSSRKLPLTGIVQAEGLVCLAHELPS